MAEQRPSDGAANGVSAKQLAERSRLERAAELDDPPREEAAAADPQTYPQRLKLPLTLAYCTLVAFNVAFAFGLRGPALLRLAEQAGIIANASTFGEADGSGSTAGGCAEPPDLREMGVANMLMTGTSTVFCLFVTGAVVDRVVHFHRLTFASCVLMAFLVLCYTWAESAVTIILLSAVQGMCLSQIMPLLAALMWVYAEDVGPSMHAFNGSFGVGMLLAPLIVSWDLAENDDFHNACE